MTDEAFEVYYGEPGNLITDVKTGDEVHIEPVDSNGTKRLEVIDHLDDDDYQTVFEIVVGPEHVAGYEVNDRER